MSVLEPRDPPTIPVCMPSWGGRITNDQIWMLTAYVRSLSSKDLSTENFSGKTVERTGH